MSRAEAKVVVEYIIDLPSDIQVANVDAYIQEELDDGADSKNIKSRIISDIAFADRPGIVERYQMLHSVLEQAEVMTDPQNKDSNVAMDQESLHDIIVGALEDVTEEEEED